jgi:cardiolipin synthase
VTASQPEPPTGGTAAPEAGDRWLTVPNVISLIRLAGVPLFLWLVLGPEADGPAFAVLAVSGVSDWADGYLARRFHWASRLGALLDPAVDRLYILSTLVALTVRGIVPLWLLALLVSRDLLLSATLPVLRRHGYTALPVHYIGKAGTFALLYAFPLLLLSHGFGVLGQVVRPIGWAAALWGTGLYWWAGVLYLEQLRRIRAADARG